MQNKFSAIIFDYGDVIELSGIKLISGITDILGISKEEWREMYLNYNHLSNVDNREWKDVALIVAQKFSNDTEKLKKMSDLFDEGNRSKKLNTELIDTIKQLKDLGFKIAVLSNYTSVLREKIKEQKIHHLFDEIIISSEEGYQKPDKKIFEITFNKLGVKSSEVIFVDDSPSSLSSAEEVGYTPILYTDNINLKNKLSSILNINF
jgi:epoxide hydrolase-like predicted phosphatase